MNLSRVGGGGRMANVIERCEPTQNPNSVTNGQQSRNLAPHGGVCARKGIFVCSWNVTLPQTKLIPHPFVLPACEVYQSRILTALDFRTRVFIIPPPPHLFYFGHGCCVCVCVAFFFDKSNKSRVTPHEISLESSI